MDQPKPEIPQGKRRLGIQSVEIGVRVLFELANFGRPAGLNELSRRLDMAASNVRRYLVSLAGANLVEQDAQTQKYFLGVSSIRLGMAAIAQRPEIDIALQQAQALRDEVDCCVGVLCPGDFGPVMIRWLENDDRITHVGKIGASFSLIHSASGRALLARSPLAAAAAAYEREARGTARPTEAGVPMDRDAFAAMLERTRERGYSWVRGDYTAGIEAAAAAACNASGEIAFILSVVGRTGIFDAGSKPHAPEALKRAAERLSFLLGESSAILFPHHLHTL
jgi:DNA-binding IclR family transcriptional regulator